MYYTIVYQSTLGAGANNKSETRDDIDVPATLNCL